jgi:ssDNA thymidine ADP-ribosyltransferase, DarT
MTPIYHITHVDNLPKIIAVGGLLSDRRVVSAGGHVVIGFHHIKRRRLDELDVPCHPGTKVGDYVPFYFCPRSPMLYIVHKGGAELAYKGGQRDVVHLVSSVEIAVATGRPYAFTGTNAGARYTTFHSDIADLDKVVDWDAVRAKYWSDPAVKERKQAEFLVHGEFPWTGFAEIGTLDADVAARVGKILTGIAHAPVARVRPEWYYS